MYNYFKDVEVGATFAHGGNVWRKVSTRTARIEQPHYISGSLFYFGRIELVKTNG